MMMAIMLCSQPHGVAKPPTKLENPEGLAQKLEKARRLSLKANDHEGLAKHSNKAIS